MLDWEKKILNLKHIDDYLIRDVCDKQTPNTSQETPWSSKQ